MASESTTIEAIPLNYKDYLPYGNVIEARVEEKSESANFGTANRFNFLADLENRRPESAKANVCVFRSVPRSLPFDIKLLERHPYSTQMFIPMTAEKRYLVIVAKGGDLPGSFILYFIEIRDCDELIFRQISQH